MTAEQIVKSRYPDAYCVQDQGGFFIRRPLIQDGGLVSVYDVLSQWRSGKRSAWEDAARCLSQEVFNREGESSGDTSTSTLP